MSERLRGLDVWHGTGPVDWPAVRDSDVRFVTVKCSDGHGRDPLRASHIAGARAAGLVVGVYAVVHPLMPPGPQMADLIAAAGDTEPAWYCLDYEIPEGPKGQYQLDFLRRCIDALRAETACDPWLYSSAEFLREMIGAPLLASAKDLASLRLWAAGYPHDPPWKPGGPRPAPIDWMPGPDEHPAVPAPWRDWAAWQYTGIGRQPGVTGIADRSVLNGDDTFLRELAGLVNRTP